MAKQSNEDMFRNIIGLVAFALTCVWAGTTWLGIDLAVYTDPIYVQYGVGIGVLVFGLLEMYTKGKYDGWMNILAWAVSGMAFITIGLTYLEVVIPDNFIYLFCGGTFIWMFVEFFRGD